MLHVADKVPFVLKALFEKLMAWILLIVIIGGGSIAYEVIKEKMKSPQQREQERTDREAAARERDQMQREMYERHGFYVDCKVKMRALKGIKTDCDTVSQSKW